jgi:hypothetical protein
LANRERSEAVSALMKIGVPQRPANAKLSLAFAPSGFRVGTQNRHQIFNSNFGEGIEI